MIYDFGIKIRKWSYCEISTDSNHMLCNSLGPGKNIVNFHERGLNHVNTIAAQIYYTHIYKAYVLKTTLKYHQTICKYWAHNIVMEISVSSYFQNQKERPALYVTNPKEDEIHSLSVRAFNMVSAVVKVFETTTTAIETSVRQITN